MIIMAKTFLVSSGLLRKFQFHGKQDAYFVNFMTAILLKTLKGHYYRLTHIHHYEKRWKTPLVGLLRYQFAFCSNNKSGSCHNSSLRFFFLLLFMKLQ